MPHHAGIGMLQQFPHVPVLHFKACFLSGNIPNGRNTVISVQRGGKKKNLFDKPLTKLMCWYITIKAYKAINIRPLISCGRQGGKQCRNVGIKKKKKHQGKNILNMGARKIHVKPCSELMSCWKCQLPKVLGLDITPHKHLRKPQLFPCQFYRGSCK